MSNNLNFYIFHLLLLNVGITNCQECPINSVAWTSFVKNARKENIKIRLAMINV